MDTPIIKFKTPEPRVVETPDLLQFKDVKPNMVRVTTKLAGLIKKSIELGSRREPRRWHMSKRAALYFRHNSWIEKYEDCYLIWRGEEDKKCEGAIRIYYAYIFFKKTAGGTMYYMTQDGVWLEGFKRNTFFTAHFFDRYAERTGRTSREDSIKNFIINNIKKDGYRGMSLEKRTLGAFPEGSGLGMFNPEANANTFITFIDVSLEGPSQEALADRFINTPNLEDVGLTALMDIEEDIFKAFRASLK